MSAKHLPSPISFVARVEEMARIRELIRSYARGCDYVAKRFLLHWHLYDAAGTLPERNILDAYLAHLGVSRTNAANLPEISTEEAHDLLAWAFHYDLARQEEMLSEEDARQCAAEVRRAVDDWAILAFTNLQLPQGRARAPYGYPFYRVVTQLGVEGGVIFVGEQDIAMVWFVDDDGPERGIMDLSVRR
jgi:hypothetical protein